MDTERLLETLPVWSDLEIAVLLSLTSKQHCLITTDDALVDDLASELGLIVSETFGLSFAVIPPESQVSVDIFGEAILDQDASHHFAAAATPSVQNNESTKETARRSQLPSLNTRTNSVANSQTTDSLDRRMVCNVVIAKDFNLASQTVQVAALELIQRRRIFSRTTVHPVPRTFLFIPVVSASRKDVRLNIHLTDRIMLSHYHDRADGLPNLEDLGSYIKPAERADARSTSLTSSSSSIRGSTSSHRLAHRPLPKVDHNVVEELRLLGQKADMTPEIRRYLQDLVVFMRLERGVAGGVTPTATTHFVDLSKQLAPLHRIDFVTPSLVALAARKIYPHRIQIAAPEKERSMLYGSKLEAVKKVIASLTPEKVVETVLEKVPTPV